MDIVRALANVTRPLRRRIRDFINPPFFKTDMTPAERDVLRSSFRSIAPQIYLELGVYWGGSFKRVLELRDQLGLSTECYGVDVWDEVADVVSTTHISGWPNRRKVGDALRKAGFAGFELLAGTAADLTRLVPGGIQLALHDANHTYQAVREDMEHMRAVLAPGARLLVHNASEHMEPDCEYVAVDGGPHRAVVEAAAEGKWTLVEIRDRMAVLTKN